MNPSKKRGVAKLYHQGSLILTQLRKVSPLWWLLSLIGAAVCAWASQLLTAETNRFLPSYERMQCWAQQTEPVSGAGHLNILVAHPVGDDDYKMLFQIRDALLNVPGVDVSTVCREVDFPKYSSLATARRTSAKAAQRLLQSRHGDLIIWGYVLEKGTKVRLFSTNRFGDCGDGKSHTVVGGAIEDPLDLSIEHQTLMTAVGEAIHTCQINDYVEANQYALKIPDIRSFIIALENKPGFEADTKRLLGNLAVAERNIGDIFVDHVSKIPDRPARIRAKIILQDGERDVQSYLETLKRERVE